MRSPLEAPSIAVLLVGAVQTELLELPMLYALFVLFEATLVTLYCRTRTSLPHEAAKPVVSEEAD